MLYLHQEVEWSIAKKYYTYIYLLWCVTYLIHEILCVFETSASSVGFFFHHCSCTRAQKLGFLICESISKRTKPEQQGEIKLHPIADLLDLRQPIKVNSQIRVSSCAENTDTHWQIITFTISINYKVCSGNELQKRAPHTVSTRMFVEVIEGKKGLGG